MGLGAVPLDDRAHASSLGRLGAASASGP